MLSDTDQALNSPSDQSALGELRQNGRTLPTCGRVWAFHNQWNLLRPRQNGRHFADGISKYIFLNENIWISMKITLKFVLKGPVNDIQIQIALLLSSQ